ncbi:hypothetical protein [Kitasatospora sp. GAS204B]|uniref:hypothetical protein n=1 Tax=unclassified Kitasatospora TaxID=2633591 RepID=UPI0024739E74|nr:hypothetical protein [Kitasatospora sp. GAS204B]MDH6120101.1 hypothetical protein [Kitasatospora sp. GAS204B]
MRRAPRPRIRLLVTAAVGAALLVPAIASVQAAGPKAADLGRSDRSVTVSALAMSPEDLVWHG